MSILNDKNNYFIIRFILCSFDKYTKKVVEYLKKMQNVIKEQIEHI